MNSSFITSRPELNANADVSIVASGLQFGVCLSLSKLCVVSGQRRLCEVAHLHMLAGAFTGY